jgi:hypothetical protein
MQHGEIQMPPDTTLVLPTGSEVVTVAGSTHVRLQVKKSLDVFAHPPKRVSIVEVKDKMGIAIMRQGAALRVATYGEFAAPGHGGASIDLTVDIPEDIEVSFEDELKGFDSQANQVEDLEPCSSSDGVSTLTRSGVWQSVLLTGKP